MKPAAILDTFWSLSRVYETVSGRGEPYLPFMLEELSSEFVLYQGGDGCWKEDENSTRLSGNGVQSEGAAKPTLAQTAKARKQEAKLGDNFIIATIIVCRTEGAFEISMAEN